MTAPDEQHEPSWCARPDHDQFPNLHRSAKVLVGPPRFHGNGQAFVWLEQAGHGPVWVGVGVAHMAWATVEISLEDAATLLDGLARLVEAGRRSQA